MAVKSQQDQYVNRIPADRMQNVSNHQMAGACADVLLAWEVIQLVQQAVMAMNAKSMMSAVTKKLALGSDVEIHALVLVV
jgi:hypothetical protein